MHRFFPAALVALSVGICLRAFATPGQHPVTTVALVPLDDRPVCTQMPEMLGDIAGVRVLLPPKQYLGHFTTAGGCSRIAEWLEEIAPKVDGVIVSTDMLCYGGLVASREDGLQTDVALARLNVLDTIHQAHPNLPMLAFGSISRTAPTATTASSRWRMSLAYYLIYRDRAQETGSKRAERVARKFLSQVPKGEVEKHLRTRRRNFDVLLALVGKLKSGVLSFVIFGQDDAEPYGPHRSERERLRAALEKAGVEGRAFVCGGIDQVACPLLARLLLRAEGQRPSIYVDWAGQNGRNYVPKNEGQSVERSMEAQIYGAGAKPADSPDKADILLFANTRKRTGHEFATFRDRLTAAINAGNLVTVADLNQSIAGEGDVFLLRYLLETRLCSKLAGYAGWNTVSNALGTAISQAAVYWLARRHPDADVRQRELSQRRFTLQRFACDYGYQNYVRPLAYDYIAKDLRAPRDEVKGRNLDLLDTFVTKLTTKVLTTYFKLGFKGTTFAAGPDGKAERLDDIVMILVGLPWPRAYEVGMSFQFATSDVASGTVPPKAAHEP